MILTGKCKEDFLKWLYSEYDFTEKEFNKLYPVNLKNALIIEFFDSVGIYINTIRNIDDTIYCRILMLDQAFYGKSRQEVTTEATKKSKQFIQWT